MNINDVKDSDLRITGEDKLAQIFRRQLELMHKYHAIEKANGLLVTDEVPVNLHDALGQYRLKDFAWRITEELGEALEAIRIHPELVEHYNEEIADALHFLVEFTILSGMSPSDIMYDHPDRDKLEYLYNLFFVPIQREYWKLVTSVGFVVEALSIACNCLKNKPWKTSQMMTDTEYFKAQVCGVWRSFINLCSNSGIDADDLVNLYFKKSEVNKFRQRTDY